MSRGRGQPLARRIVVAFVLMTFVVSGAFSLGLVYVVRKMETDLVSKTMGGRLGTFVVDHVPRGEMPHTERGLRFFLSDDPRLKSDIPPEFQGARPGFNEIGDNWVVVQERDGRRYMLVQDQHEFEAYEQTLFVALFAGFLLTIAGAWGLGALTARRIMSPVIHLAEAVRHLDASAPSAPLAREYAEDEIGQLAAAFDDALARLAGALERERLFTSDVSHELRTPLMVVATSCELLETAALAPREHEQVARIARAAGEMRALVETFLVLARAHPESAPQATAVAAPMSTAGERLADTARAQAERWREAIHAKGLRFTLLHEAEDEGRYDTACLNAVMGNLLRNALHYTERGDIRLILEQGGFRVEDSGIGIPEAEREKVFESFARGATAPGEGLGLGLSLVRRVCAHQGWHITLDALPEGGSRFRVRLCRMCDLP